MKKNFKIKAVVTLSAIAMAVTCVAIVGNTVTANAAEGTPYAFENTQVIGAQLRLDDDGMRFVVEMSPEDYTAYSASKEEGAELKYSLGVLIIPSDLAGTELTWDTANKAYVEFSDEYKPAVVKKEVEGVETIVGYRFNAVLKDIPEFARKITARPYIAYNGEYDYKNTIERNVSYIASEYFDDYTDSATEEYAKIREYVYKAYNDYKGTEYASYDEFIAAVADFSVSMNDIDAIMLDGNNGDYSNVLKSDLDELFNVDYTATSANATKGAVTIDEETKAVTGETRGKVAINGSTLNGELTSSSYSVTVMDETALVQGAYYGADGNYIDWAGAKSFYDHAYENLYQGLGMSFDHLQSAEYITEEVYGRTGNSGKLTKVLPLLQDNREQFYVQAAFEYSKEQLKMFLDNGYTMLSIPLYMEIDIANLANDEANAAILQYNAETGTYRNYLDLYVPTADLSADGASMAVNYNSYRAAVSYQRFFINQWQNVNVSLQVVYDNYDKLTALTANQTALFGILTGRGVNYGTIKDSSGVSYKLNFNLYMDDITIGKIAHNTTDIATDAEGNALRDENGNPINLYVDLSDVTKAGDMLLSTAYTNGWFGSAQLVSGTVFDKDTTATNGNYIMLGNGNLLYSASYNSYTSHTNSQVFYIDGIGYTKAQLQTLLDAGYDKLVLNCRWDIHNQTGTSGLYGLWGKQVNSVADDGTVTYKDAYTVLYEDRWTALSISVQYLIDNYDTLFDTTSATRTHLFQYAKLNGDTTQAASIYIGEIRFAK